MMRVRPEVLDWLEEAKADLRHAEDSLSSGSFNWACFAAQQGAEKALKAFMMAAKRRRSLHVHDLTRLHAEMEDELELPEEVIGRLGELSSFYTIARYPNAGVLRPSVSITRPQAERAIQTAREVLRLVDEKLEHTTSR